MQGATRLERLVRRPKRTLGGLVMALIAIGVAVGTGANFSAEATNPSNTFTAGVVKMDNSKDNAAIISATNMKPGAWERGTVDIKNTGSMDMVVTLKRDMLGTYETGLADPVPMTQKINLIVTDCGAYADDGTAPVCGDRDDHQVHPNGTLAAMTDPIELGTFAKDEKRRYQFEAQLDYTAGNEYVNDAVMVRFVWTGDQTH